MKTIRYQMMSLALALLAVGCNDDEIASDRHPANTGDEVQFGVTLPGGSTRTIYGEETETETGFPVYWVNGDKVKVASPQCDIKEAEYQVTVSTETQNYADKLTKTGAAGIQWGESETADFYSIYPSESTTFSFAGNTVTADLSVDATQYASIKDNGKSYYAQPTDMNNVVMYAKNANVSKTSETVPLQYTPFSTVIEFEITAPDEDVAGKTNSITIQALTLTAPTGKSIAGNFTFRFPATEGAAPSVSPATGGSNAITLHLLENDQYTTTLSPAKPTLKAKMCLMPISGVTNLQGWTVAVNTSVGTFSKDLTDKTGELKPGLVHKVKLPVLGYTNGEWEYDLKNWITALPDYKNIYLTEISIPGAWYITQSEYQGNDQTISNLWDKGIRAFAAECRTGTAGRYWTTPNSVQLSGTGTNGNTLNNKFYHSGTKIREVIRDVAAQVKADEFGVLVLSYADGGVGGHRDEDHDFFINGVKEEITQSTATNIHDKQITSNTTVKDVLGKLIVVVTVNHDITVKDNYTGGMNALFCYTPFPNQIVSDGRNLSQPQFSKLSWQTWTDNNKDYATANNSDFLWCFSSANRTDCTDTTSEDGTVTNNTVSTLSQRKAALRGLMSKSREIYEQSSHNIWFYMQCGGTHATSSDDSSTDADKFTTGMNIWLKELIEKKTEPSSMGIVTYNKCTEETGIAITRAIVEMNSKFYLKHAGDSSTGGDTGQSDVRSSAPGFSSGVVDNNESAFTSD